MTLNPLEPCPTAEFLSLFYLFKDLFNQVLVLNRPSDASDPVVLDPVNVPDGDTVNGILRIGVNEYLAVQRRDVNGTEYRGKLCSLVGLARTCKGLRNVSGA